VSSSESEAPSSAEAGSSSESESAGSPAIAGSSPSESPSSSSSTEADSSESAPSLSSESLPAEADSAPSVYVVVGVVLVLAFHVVLAGTRNRAGVARLVRIQAGARVRPGFLGRRRDLPRRRRQRVALDRAAPCHVARVAAAARRLPIRCARRDRAVGGLVARASELASARGASRRTAAPRRAPSSPRRARRPARPRRARSASTRSSNSGWCGAQARATAS